MRPTRRVSPRPPDGDWQVRLLYRMPNVLLEEPFEVFVSVLCLITGVPLIFGAVGSASIDAALPPLLASAWGVVLVTGSGMTLVGLRLTYGTTSFHRMMTGRRIERYGLLCLTWASLIYSGSILVWVGLAGAVSAGILLAFAFTCLTKAFVLSAGTRLLHKALAVAVESYDAGR